MASMNRFELEELYKFLKKAFAFAPTKGLAEEAKLHAQNVEDCIGQQEPGGVYRWN